MSTSHRMGELGEEMARVFLQMNGYRYLQGRYRIAGGELDLIMAQGRAIVFVEVKTRNGRSPAPPEHFLNARQLQRLRMVAGHWLRNQNYTHPHCRIDLVAVEWDKHPGQLQIRHYPNVG